MPVASEHTGDFPSTSFIMDNVSEVLKSDTPTYERRDIPAGVYEMQVCNVLPREYFDKPDCYDEDKNNPRPDAIAKRLIPLEVIDGEYANERYHLADQKKWFVIPWFIVYVALLPFYGGYRQHPLERPAYLVSDYIRSKNKDEDYNTKHKEE